MGRIEKILTQVETVRKSVERLDKVSDKLDELFGNYSFLDMLDEEIQEEAPFAERGCVCVTGAACFTWPFSKIIKFWSDVYKSDSEQRKESMRRMAAEFHTLADMFEKEAG
jgi:hypothetical protein